jgi:hypothetical protein
LAANGHRLHAALAIAVDDRAVFAHAPSTYEYRITPKKFSDEIGEGTSRREGQELFSGFFDGITILMPTHLLGWRRSAGNRE